MDCSVGDKRNENRKAWQHMLNAGLVAGIENYKGAAGNIASTPESKAGGYIYWDLFNNRAYNSGPDSKINGLMLSIGRTRTGAQTGGMGPATEQGVFTAEQAWSIDSKLDDGLADSGNVSAWRGQVVSTPQTGCVSGFHYSNAVSYMLEDTQKSCILNFKIK